MECKRTGSWLIYETNLRILTTETHDALEDGHRMSAPTRIVAKKQLNFQSYPMKGIKEKKPEFKKKISFGQISSYKRDYPPPAALSCEPLKPKENDPDPLFNRRPVNYFLLQPSMSTKFMDDGLYNMSSRRLKVNFFRQIRNQSHIFAENREDNGNSKNSKEN